MWCAFYAYTCLNADWPHFKFSVATCGYWSQSWMVQVCTFTLSFPYNLL